MRVAQCLLQDDNSDLHEQLEEEQARFEAQVPFERFEAGYAAAMGLGLSFVSGVIVLIFVFLRRRGWEV